MDFNTSRSNSNCGEPDHKSQACKISSSCISILSSLDLPETVCMKWQAIGYEMGFEKERLDEIEREHSSNTADCFRVMMSEWWNCCDTPQFKSCCSLKFTLVQVLSKPCVGLKHIACKLQKDICGCTCAFSVKPESEFEKDLNKGGATVRAIHQMNNPWENSNLSPVSTCDQGLHLPDESRVKDFRSESDLAEKTRHLEKDFFELIHKTFSSLKTTQVPMHDILVRLAHFEDADRFTKAKNLDEFVVILGSNVSWFNYSLLEIIVEDFGTKDVQQAMSCYVRHLKATLEERRVSELPCDIYKKASGKCDNPSIVENNKQKLGVKIDYIWEKFLVRDIQIVRKRIASILGIEERSLFLLSVSEGCVYLEFLVPEFVSEEILSLEISPDIHSEFERARVFEIECNSVLVYTNEVPYNVEISMCTYPSTECLFNELVEVS